MVRLELEAILRQYWFHRRTTVKYFYRNVVATPVQVTMVPALSLDPARLRDTYRKATSMLYNTYFSYRHRPDQNVMAED